MTNRNEDQSKYNREDTDKKVRVSQYPKSLEEESKKNKKKSGIHEPSDPNTFKKKEEKEREAGRSKNDVYSAGEKK